MCLYLKVGQAINLFSLKGKKGEQGEGKKGVGGGQQRREGRRERGRKQQVSSLCSAYS